MLTAAEKNMIQGDFEKFLQHLKQNKLSLSFDSYGDYAVSVLNFYVGSSLLKPADKREAAQFLTQLFNAGFQNRISQADIQEIAESIAQDPTLEYQFLQPIFS